MRRHASRSPYSYGQGIIPIELDGIPTAGIKDIAAMKAYTIGKRTSLKDYVDVYALLQQKHIGLLDMIELALAKYKSEFNDRLFLEQLISLEDVGDDAIQFLKEPVNREQMQAFFEGQVKSLKL